MNAQAKADATLAARYLGSLSKGIPKRITPADAKQRSLRLAEARKKRWIKLCPNCGFDQDGARPMNCLSCSWPL
jgi:hypothetical protein